MKKIFIKILQFLIDSKKWHLEFVFYRTYMLWFFLSIFIPLSSTPAFSADIVYNTPINSVWVIADWVNWNGATDTETATQFCIDEWFTYVSHDIQSSNSSGSWTVRNYNNTIWETQSLASWYNSITCDDWVTGWGSSTGSTSTWSTTWSWSVVYTTVNVTPVIEWGWWEDVLSKEDVASIVAFEYLIIFILTFLTYFDKLVYWKTKSIKNHI